LDVEDKTAIKNGVSVHNVKLTEVQIFNILGSAYSWDKNILGLPAVTAANFAGIFRAVASGELPTVAQLQPSINGIHLALGLPATIIDIPA